MRHVLLHTNTEFSFLNSTIKIQKLVKLAIKNNIKTLAITDVNNMFGLGVFLDLCQKNNIKPIIGIELTLKEATVFLLAKNYEGYVFLNQLAFKKSKDEQIEIKELENENVFVIDHETKGFLKSELTIPKISNFWANHKTILISQTVYAPVKKVLVKEDKKTLNMLQQIGNLPVDNEEFNDFFSNEDFELVDTDVLNNIQKIVDLIDIKFPDSTIKLASYKKGIDISNEEYLQKKCFDFLRKNVKLFLNFEHLVIRKRFDYEFSVIKKLGFIDYFLIIVDVLDWARSQKIYVGPGRGSVAGSLIAFLLEITKINPLKYNLLFERFLNSERVTMPDIDIDIQDDRREEVTKYIESKYGYEYTSLITTFQTIGAKMAIRDVARVLKISLLEVDKISKSIGNSETLSEAYKKNNKFKSIINNFPFLREMALGVEGFPRQHGTHPAGIIISNQKITSVAPTYWNNTSMQQIQLSLNYLEKFGLLKIDFLGLKTLNIINDIEKTLPPNLAFEVLTKTSEDDIFNDKSTLKLINDGHTEGIFQLESPGMKNAISKVKANTFDDLVAIISLFRPGPMEYIEQYGKNKLNPKFITKIHPIYDKIVASTFGIIVYQEQIMEIAQKVANMSFSQADLLRRAISKKDENELKKYQTSFFKGGKINGFEIKKLEEIYNNIEKFADYGFNKSHAVSYAYITFKMAFYKAHFPIIFYRSLLTSAQGAHSTINRYVAEIKKAGINVISPNINKSKKHVVIINNELVLPFNMIKGLGIVAVDKILDERKINSQYLNFYQCYLRLRYYGVTDGIIDSLIKSSTMRDFGNQQTLFKQLNSAKSLYAKLVGLFKNEKRKNNNKEIEESVKKEMFSNFLKNEIKNLEFSVYDLNIEEEEKNEIEFLGRIYNAFVTLPYENEIKIENLPIEREVWVAACIEKILFSKIHEKNIIHLFDSSQSLVLYLNKKDFERFKNMPKNRVIYVKLYRSMKNWYYLQNWKEINE